MKKALIYISIGVGRTQGFDILVLKLIAAYIKAILLSACNACVASEHQDKKNKAKSFHALQ